MCVVVFRPVSVVPVPGKTMEAFPPPLIFSNLPFTSQRTLPFLIPFSLLCACQAHQRVLS